MTNYYDTKGKIVRVSSQGTRWASFREQESGALRRINVPKALPVRDKFEDAQADLDSYALKKGWKAVTEEVEKEEEGQKEQQKGKEGYADIPLTDIRVNPVNPRKSFEGQEFDELVKSVEQKGILQPILVRPKENYHEIVAGERRFHALVRIANQNGEKDRTIPAIIRNLSDDEAFDCMIIENLQRKDLNELEEAKSFRTYLDTKGRDTLPDLAERIGCHPSYIRRRTAVLNLSDDILKSWEDGDLKFGHLYQLTRVSDPEKIRELYEEILDDDSYDTMTVKELKAQIEDFSVSLEKARFDRENCKLCLDNSSAQKKLFGEDTACLLCLKPKCFREKQGEWVRENWGEFKAKYGTNGFLFRDDYDYSAGAVFWRLEDHTPEFIRSIECAGCNNFLTILTTEGASHYPYVCVGKRSCYANVAKIVDEFIEESSGDGTSDKTPGEASDKTPGEASGEASASESSGESLNEIIATLDYYDDDITAMKVMLMALLEKNLDADLGKWFVKSGLSEHRFAGNKPFDLETVASVVREIRGLNESGVFSSLMSVVGEIVQNHVSPDWQEMILKFLEDSSEGQHE